MSQTHVIHVVESFATGTREIVRLLANEQVEHGLTVSVWYGEVAASLRDPNIGFDSRVELVRIPHLKDRSLGSLIAACVWLRKLRCSKEAIVHAHSTVAGVLVRVACMRRAKPVVYTPHAFALVRRDLNRASRTMFTWLERVLSKTTHTVFVACSASEAAVIREHLPNVRICTVENGLDWKERRARAQLPKFNKPLKAVAVGRVCKQKNFDDLLVLKEHFGSKLRIQVVGAGDARTTERLKSSGVSVSGWVDAETVERYLDEADFFLQTSLWEGMPVSVMEAQFKRVPVIARDAVGTRDLVIHNVTGLVYTTGEDLIALVDNFRSVAWEPMCVAAHAKITQENSSYRMHLGYLAAYNSI